MKNVRLTIDNRDVSVPSESSILDAAGKLGINIPTLCHIEGLERFTSCMVCVVYEAGEKRLIPACSAVVSQGMRIETENDRVREARKDALDFLLSEHIGDCEAPCRRACPAHMDIPLMIRQIEEGRLKEAVRTIKEDIPLPAVLGRICPAPCEKGCHRGSFEEPVSICALKKYVADVDLALESPFRPDTAAESGKKVAVVGSGPAGLSAAYYILRHGHSCHVFDDHPQPGGMLRYGVSEEVLPRIVLDREIERIADLGAVFVMGRSLGADLGWDELNGLYDAVVLAVGKLDFDVFKDSGIAVSRRGIAIDRKTHSTSKPGFFAGGNAVSESRMAIRAVAHGKNMALSANQFLKGEEVTGPRPRFQCILGKPREDEEAEFSKEAAGCRGRVIPADLKNNTYSDEEAVRESSRCFGCDCRKPDACKLRRYAREYQADQKRFAFVERKSFRKIIQHELVVYEPGKCIKCGLCVQITKKAGEKFGLTFVGRGFEVRVQTPFQEPLSRGLEKAAGDCVRACPTGALSWKDRSDDRAGGP